MILRTENLVKSFDGIKAVDNFTMDVEEGVIAGLIGPNGAGKTTLFNLVTGFMNPDSGRITFDGEEITEDPMHDIVKHGIVRTFQVMRPLPRMTVLENLMLAEPEQTGERLHNPFIRPDDVEEEESEIKDQALEILDLFGLREKKDDYAGGLSGGQRRLLELARSLMTSPKMLLLDEPTGGVNPSLISEILDHLKYLNDQGLTILMIEHNIQTIMDLSDVVYVMTNGRKIAQGPPGDIQENEEVIDAYLGG